MSNADLARYHALLAEADALARTLYWRALLTAETVDVIAARLRALLTGRVFTVTEQTCTGGRWQVQVAAQCQLAAPAGSRGGVLTGRYETHDETWGDILLFLQGERGPHYNFSTAAYSMYSAPVFCFGPESVTIERVKLARPPLVYPQRIVFALEEAR